MVPHRVARSNNHQAPCPSTLGPNHRPAAVAYLVVVGSVVVFVLYLVVLRYWAASRAAYGFVLIPFVTVLLSAWLDHEPLGRGLLLGGLLALAT